MREIRYGFNTGEVGPEFRGRGDVEKYDLGAAYIENFFVDYSGSLFKRYGTSFAGAALSSSIRILPYQSATDSSEAIHVIFDALAIRFLVNGQYFTASETSVISVVDGLVTAPSHGFVDGTLVQVDGFPREVVVKSATADTFRMSNGADTVTEVFNSGATLTRKIFSIVSPYSVDDLFSLTFFQDFDTIKISSQLYPTYLLRPTVSGWEIVQEAFDQGKPLVGALTATSSGRFIKSVKVNAKGTGYADTTDLNVSDANGVGAELLPIIQSSEIVGVTIVDGGHGYTSPSITTANAGGGTGAAFEIVMSKLDAEVVFAVSAVIDGKETGTFRPKHRINITDFTQVRASITYTWPAVEDADSYRVYRSFVHPFEGESHIGVELGYIGTVRGTSMTDANIQPDFTQSPVIYNNPFARGAVRYIEVTAGGSGYTKDSTLSLTLDTGSGFVGYPIVYGDEVIGVYIADHGTGYTSPAVSVSDGTGATFDVTVGPTTGTFPGCAATFQQRAVYAGTINQPLTLFGSRINDHGNFSFSQIVTDADPYEFDVDTTRFSTIRHVLPTKQGLMLFLDEFVAILRGPDGQSVTALNKAIDVISYQGSSRVAPIFAEEDVLYCSQQRNSLIRIAAARADSRGFETQEISFFAREIFKGRTVKSLAQTIAENNLLYGVFSDGEGVIGTIHAEQDTFAFTRMTTAGKILDAATVRNANGFTTLFAVERDGVVFLETLVAPESKYLVDALHLDCATQLPKVTPAARVTLSAKSGTVTITASAAVFSSGDVGKIFGGLGGRGLVTVFVSTTSITVTLTATADRTTLEEGEWYLNPLVTSVSGIPLEGQTVTIVGDGKNLGTAVVEGGEITLPQPAALVTVGLPFTAEVRHLPPPASAGREINYVALHVLTKATGEIIVGVENKKEYVPPMRLAEPWNEANTQRRRLTKVRLSGDWNDEGDCFVRSVDGLPLEIIQSVIFYEERKENYDIEPPSTR